MIDWRLGFDLVNGTGNPRCLNYLAREFFQCHQPKQTFVIQVVILLFPPIYLAPFFSRLQIFAILFLLAYFLSLRIHFLSLKSLFQIYIIVIILIKIKWCVWNAEMNWKQQHNGYNILPVPPPQLKFQQPHQIYHTIYPQG